jgi:hypothetical protein
MLAPPEQALSSKVTDRKSKMIFFMVIIPF